MTLTYAQLSDSLAAFLQQHPEFRDKPAKFRPVMGPEDEGIRKFDVMDGEPIIQSSHLVTA